MSVFDCLIRSEQSVGRVSDANFRLQYVQAGCDAGFFFGFVFFEQIFGEFESGLSDFVLFLGEYEGMISGFRGVDSGQYSCLEIEFGLL